MKAILILSFLLLSVSGNSFSQQAAKVIAFYTAENDLAHISFVNEALPWFEKLAKEKGFKFSSTSDWDKMTIENLKNYQLVIFLDTRPEASIQRQAFEKYMESGGAWMGFHFSAFALTPSDFPQNWDWYHEKFLGSGQYDSNTWRPTGAILKIEQPNHEIFDGLSTQLQAAPNEWYKWEHDLRENPDIEILASIDPRSFPLGTGPKAHEIWHEGYYPVIWTNTNYRMVYFNMGHNDMDYDGGTNKPLSTTLASSPQTQVISRSLNWLLKK
ncbi:ThuA domain-containing protein [Algoriphagus resistens]|uniref:ThuA domain-containing protein n=1 Tax=Algoriphagus resistens TaxID=1750590 RepID=UPI000716C151|nr:ThuA domain-containing protein [Algoriphagus resistens]